jgi:hypothetical protein
MIAPVVAICKVHLISSRNLILEEPDLSGEDKAFVENQNESSSETMS